MEKYCPECGTEYPADQERCDRDGRRLVATISDDLWVGRELDGRYHVSRVLGKGGMGTVFEVEQTLLGRRLALKLLRRELGQDKASVMRFFAEAKALASLRSPHTVTLHDFGATEEGQLFFTMDLLEGHSLSELLANEGRLSYGRACGLVLQVLESLEEAHDRNILHRDLKPENVFVTQVKGREFAVVLDFGIAKLVGDPNHEGVTNTGLICGTPAYMSPEQALGNPAVKASDLYTLGVMLYEMLSGQLPFAGSTALRLAMSHITELPVPVSQRALEANIPQPLERFLEQVLVKEASLRFPDAAAFRAALLQAMFQCAETEQVDVRLLEVEEVLQASSADWSVSSWTGLQRLAVPGHKVRTSVQRTRWKAMGVISGLSLALAVGIGWGLGAWERTEGRQESMDRSAGAITTGPQESGEVDVVLATPPEPSGSGSVPAVVRVKPNPVGSESVGREIVASTQDGASLVATPPVERAERPSEKKASAAVIKAATEPMVKMPMGSVLSPGLRALTGLGKQIVKANGEPKASQPEVVAQVGKHGHHGEPRQKSGLAQVGQAVVVGAAPTEVGGLTRSDSACQGAQCAGASEPNSEGLEFRPVKTRVDPTRPGFEGKPPDGVGGGGDGKNP